MALLTGQLAEERPLGAIDRAPFIWKDFSKAGYRTLYVEDGFIENQVFNIAVEGNNRPGGFVSVPTDYYFRTLSVAMHANYGLLDWRDAIWRMCTGPILEDELILNWVSSVLYSLLLLLSIRGIGADSIEAMGAIAPSLPWPKSCGGDALKSPLQLVHSQKVQ